MEDVFGRSVQGTIGESLASLSTRMDSLMKDARSSVSWGIMMARGEHWEAPIGIHAYHQRTKGAREWELYQGIWRRTQECRLKSIHTGGGGDAGRRGLTPGEAGAIGLGQTCSGNSAGDGPDLPLTFFDRERNRYPWTGTAHQVGQRHWGTGANLAEEFSGIPHPFEDVWPVGRSYAWMHEESDPNWGSSLSMVWVISQFTNEDMEDVPELPQPRWIEGAARLELTIVAELAMSEDLVFDVLVRHSWDDSVRGPDPVYHGPHPDLSPQAILEMQMAWEVEIGEAAEEVVGIPREGPGAAKSLFFEYSQKHDVLAKCPFLC